MTILDDHLEAEDAAREAYNAAVAAGEPLDVCHARGAAAAAGLGSAPTSSAPSSPGVPRYEALGFDEIHNLRASGPDGEAAYQQLRADWIRRGSPRRANT